MKRVFYIFAIFIFISFLAIGCVLNYLAHSSIHKATEFKVKRDLEILATTTQGALAKNDYERVEEQVFLWGELEPHIISFEVILDDDIEIIKYAREIQSSHILSLDKTISLPSGRIITFCIKYDLSGNDKDATILTAIFLSMSSFIAVVFIFLLWQILQRLAFIPLNREITERKQAEEERSELAKILEGSLNEIYIFDAETLKFLLVNKGARINLGYPMEELKELCPLDI
jgi:PAS domain-containing protein